MSDSVNPEHVIRADEQPPRSWLGRNWKWAVPVGCLGPFLLIGGCGAMLLLPIIGFLRSSDTFTKSLAKVRADERVVAALGEPIEPSWLVQGNIQVTNRGGHAEVQYEVTGPNDAATVYAVADKIDGQWQFQKLKCKRQSNGEVIDLLDEPEEKPGDNGPDLTAQSSQFTHVASN